MAKKPLPPGSSPSQAFGLGPVSHQQIMDDKTALEMGTFMSKANPKLSFPSANGGLVPGPEATVEAEGSLDEKFEVKCRPLDGRRPNEVPKDEFMQHLLLRDRHNGRTFRVASTQKLPGVTSQTLQLREVFEDFDGPAPWQIKMFEKGREHFGGDLLNTVWKECWSRKGYKPYRDLVRRAVPFTFDTTSTRLITELAAEHSKVCLYRQLARLPYEVIWLEFDYREKVRTQIRMGSRKNPYKEGDEPTSMGYLLERLSETRWRCTSWVETLVTKESADTMAKAWGAGEYLIPGEYLVEVMPPQVILDTEGTVDGYKTQMRDPALVHGMQSLIDTSELPAGIAWGLKAAELASVAEDGKPIVHVDPRLRRSVCYDVPLCWEALLQRVHPRPHERRDALVSMMELVALEQQGMLRWVCAALASINAMEPDGLLETRDQPKQGAFRADGQLRPYKVNRHVTLRLPGRARLSTKHVLKLFQGAKRRMARHHVRGFWRTTAKTERPGERWQWMYSQRYREHRWHIWVNEFDRGDATLGYVQRDYEVTS